jgi:predicted transporter
MQAQRYIDCLSKVTSVYYLVTAAILLPAYQQSKQAFIYKPVISQDDKQECFKGGSTMIRSFL